MKAAFGSVFVVAALMAVPAPMRAAVPQATASADHNLDERIEKRLSASPLKKYNVKVSVTNGIATLTGTVATGSRSKAGHASWRRCRVSRASTISSWSTSMRQPARAA